jgi:hypothetical protein
MKYLYGASVQGIQGFIFETNKLQEIVGASEIVKSIEEKFLTFSNYGKENKNILLNAAGNIKALFDEKEYCENLVKSFSKHIQQEAYGITISQAVIVIDGETPTEDEFKKLDDKLKIQRNRPSIPLDMSLNIMELSPATAKPVSNKEKKGKDELLFDKASWQKREAFPQNDKFKELSDLSNGKNKLAVIHADGNGLGELIPDLKEKLNISLSDFSKKLDKATEEAFLVASRDIKKIKSIILGGDDLVVICDANDALNFTKDFLYYFEKETESIIGTKLTACAGIAYTNEKYPFHYAVSLAEDLCSETKKHAKKLREKEKLKVVPSSLMFHNIQSSNYQTWSKFVEDELTIRNDSCSIRCDFGPYYVDKENQPLISDFLNSVGAYACDGSPISRLRNWLSELGKSRTYSENLLQRINTMLEQSNEWNCKIMDKNLENLYSGLSNDKLIIKKDGELKTPIYDILQILSVTEAK